MISFADLQRSITYVKSAARLESLEDALEEMTAMLGFSYFGLAHHADLSNRRQGLVAIGNYPANWILQIVERRLYADDPVHVASQRTSRSFRWSELPELITMTEKHRNQLEAARRSGLVEGLTIPIHLPGNLPASCSFVLDGKRAFPEEAVPHAHYAGCFAFEAARRLTAAPREQASYVQLSGRQLDCIVLVSQGKSDTSTAQLLGISSETVHQHVETAKRKLGVATRQQLVARALFDGHLTYSDILN